MDSHTQPKIVGPQDGKARLPREHRRPVHDRRRRDRRAASRSSSTRWRPRALAAPLHRHTREDEYSYVLEGRMGALLGDDVVDGRPGRPGPQAAQPVAHLLERRRRAVPHPRDHRPGRLRATSSRELSDMGGVASAEPGDARRAQRALRARDAAGLDSGADRALRRRVPGRGPADDRGVARQPASAGAASSARTASSAASTRSAVSSSRSGPSGRSATWRASGPRPPPISMSCSSSIAAGWPCRPGPRAHAPR